VLLSDFHFNSTSTGTARLAIDAGGGDDLVAVTNWSITDPISEALSGDTPIAGEIEMSIATAAGNDQVLIGESKFQNLVLKVDTGAGNDSAPIPCNWFDGSSELSFSLATGDDALSLRENTFAAAMKLNVDAGAGNDFVAFLCDAVHDAAILSFSLGAGDDTLAVMQNSFGGSLKLTVTGGAGNDKVTIIGNSFKGSNPFDVRLGTGNDQSLIQEKSFDPKLDKLSALEQLRLKQAMERVSKLEKHVSNTRQKASASLAVLLASIKT
jgi:hypothetical protein